MKPANDFREAADELAAEFRSRQFPDNITDAEALKMIDWEVLKAWMVEQLADRTGKQLLSDCMERITEDQARDILATATINGCRTNPIIGECLTAECAHDLAYESQRLVDNYDPTDSEMSRSNYGSWVDDPVGADRKVIARKYSP